MTAVRRRTARSQIFVGDCLDVLPTLDAESVHCCITSPPYWGLRDYGHDDQIGLEQSLDDYINTMVRVFREVRRVLRADGSLWLNIGDTWSKTISTNGGFSKTSTLVGNSGDKVKYRTLRKTGRRVSLAPRLPKKNICGVPWRVALALQADGWILRQDIIWNKPNAMPESCKDRCTKAHEYVFLLTKSPRYFFDYKSIQEPATTCRRVVTEKSASYRSMISLGRVPRSGNARLGSVITTGDRRNKRSVWAIATEPLREAHFAAMPKKLVEPCLLAGAPPGGIVLDPFAGSGTVGVVAAAHDRRFLGIELNPEYAAIAASRIKHIRTIHSSKEPR